MNKKKETRYVIGKSAYEKHIEDKARLCGLLLQLGYLANAAKNDDDRANIVLTALLYGSIAEEMFSSWNIPHQYLVRRDRKDLTELQEKELESLSAVLTAHDTENMEKALHCLSWDQNFIIQGGSFRMLVNSISILLDMYATLAQKVETAENSRDLVRLKKMVEGSKSRIRRLCCGWGVPKEQELSAYDVLERAVRQKHLIPFEVVSMEESQDVDETWDDALHE